MNLIFNPCPFLPEDLLLQADLVEIWPKMCEANAMSEELNKKVKFEIALISPQARGLVEGKTEVCKKNEPQQKRFNKSKGVVWERWEYGRDIIK